MEAKLVAVNAKLFEIERITRNGEPVGADTYLPTGQTGPNPVLLGAAPRQKGPPLPPVAASVFQFIQYGPMRHYLDYGYTYVAMDVPGASRSKRVWDRVSRYEGKAIHDRIEHVVEIEWSNGMIGMSGSCRGQSNARRARPPHLAIIGTFEGTADVCRNWMCQGAIPVQGFLNPWLFGSVLARHMADGLSLPVSVLVRKGEPPCLRGLPR